MRTLSVIIPCYNEAATIGAVVEKVKSASVPPGWRKELIVVDDGSNEPTRSAVRTLTGVDQVVYRERNGGKGAAVKDGLRVATGDYCIIQDADLELDPNDFSALLAPIERGEVEAVFGYRSPGAGNTVLFYGGRLVSFVFNLVFGTPFRDIPCCYKIFPRRCIDALLRAPSNDFVFDAVEMTHAVSSSCTVAQVPVSYHPRSPREGKKLRVRHGIYSAIAIVLLRLGVLEHPLAHEFRRMFRFLLSGLITLGINIVALYAFTEWAHVWYLASSVLAFIISYAANFSLHKFWTFRDPALDTMPRQLPRHLSLALFNTAFNAVLMYVFVEYLHIWYVAAQVLAAAIIALESFFLLARFVFKKEGIH